MPADATEGRELVEEVCEVVEQNYTDTRNGGFDRTGWQALKENALARPVRDRAAAYGCVLQLGCVTSTKSKSSRAGAAGLACWVLHETPGHGTPAGLVDR